MAKKPKRTRGVKAYTQSGKEVILFGPPRPIKQGKRYINPRFSYSSRVLPDKPASGRKSRTSPKTPRPPRSRARVQQSGITGSSSRTGDLSWADNPSNRRKVDARRAAARRASLARTKGLPKEWRDSLALSAERAIEARAAEFGPDGDGGGIAGFVGRTLQGVGRRGIQFIGGIPEASARGVYLTGRGMQFLSGRGTRNVGEQLDAGREVIDEGIVEPITEYYAPLAKRLATEPINTIENELLDVVLAAAGVTSVAGQGPAFAARMAGRATQQSRAIRQGGGLRAGRRIYRGELNRMNAQQLRDLQLRQLRDTASRGRADRDPLRFVGRKDLDDQARKAAEITGAPTLTPRERAVASVADRSSRSILPGSSRYREPRMVAPQGRLPGDPDPIPVAQRPYSSNPITRTLQRRVTEPLGRRLRGQIDDKIGSAWGTLTAYEMAVSRDTRKMADEALANTDATVVKDAKRLAKLVARLKGAGRSGQLPESEVARGSTAAILRAMGVADMLDGSVTWGRDTLVQRLNAWLEDPKKGGSSSKRKRRSAQRQLETLQSIPDEWFDPVTSPKWLNELEGEVRKVLAKGTSEKRAMGAISESSANWAGRRAQAQLGFNARPYDEVVGKVTQSVRDDRKKAREIEAELRERRNKGRGLSSEFEGFPLTEAGYAALETTRQNLLRRARTMQARTQEFRDDARRSALEGFDEDNALSSQVAAARERVRELSSRPQTAEIRQQLKDARAEFTRIANFEKQRAAERKRMADQGARAEARAAAGRRQRSPEIRNRREDLEFDVERAGARVAMARQGRSAMAGAAARRARTRTTAGRRRQTNVNPTVAVSTRQVFEAGRRKGRASVDPSARGFGTMLRADGRLYVVNQRARRTQDERSARRAENERIRREEIEPGVRAQGEAAASRRQLTDAETRARRELDAARRELSEFNAQSRRRQARPETPAQRRARRDVAQAGAPRRRSVPPGAKETYDRIKELQSALAAARASRNGTPAQIRAAAEQLRVARRNLEIAKRRFLRRAYVGSKEPERAGLAPGEYFPQVSPLRGEMDTRFNTAVRGRFQDAPDKSEMPQDGRVGASLTAPSEKFNASRLADDGLLLLSPRLVVDALRSAVSVRERVTAAAALVAKYAATHDGRLIEGKAARDLVARSNGRYTLISQKQLASITSLSTDSVASKQLLDILRDVPGGKVGKDGVAQADVQLAVPTAAVRGWRQALDPNAGNPGARLLDYVTSLWKGGVLALNPRWYIQNFFGMWGQFALGAGADLQAISMARNPDFIEAIPGRISQMGLSQEFGEYARRAQGDATNWLGSLIRAGYFGNAMLESVPRRAMYWHMARKGLDENQIMRRGIIDPAFAAEAWLDLAKAAGKGDRGANAILDEALLVTERFMGNYSTYNGLERTVLKRIFPFYAWMRAINRLGFALPFKHPKRAALLGAASLMAYDERNDLTGYRQGVFLGLSSQAVLNTIGPAYSLIPSFEAPREVGRITAQEGLAAGARAAGPALLRSALQESGPAFGELSQVVTGETLSGVPTTYPPGYQGIDNTAFSGGVYTDIFTGQKVYADPSPDLLARLQSLIPWNNVARNILAGDKTPYGTTSTLDLVEHAFRRGIDADGARAQEAKLFQEARPRQYTEPWWSRYGTRALLGVPVVQYNLQEMARRQYDETDAQRGRYGSRYRKQKKPRSIP